MSAIDPIVIVSTARTPMGGFEGDFASVTAARLGSAAIKAAVARAGIAPEDVEEVAFGNVLSAGQGQAPARQAALGAGLPLSTTCTTLNKMCGSGMKAAMYAHDMLIAGSADVVLAGGMESMSNAPYLLPKARAGLRMGHAELKDHMFFDGLEDAYDKGRLMGTFAEDCAESYQFTREAQDDYAFASLDRAIAAIEGGYFDVEVTPVTVKSRNEEVLIRTDEQPAKAKRDKIRNLRPAFRKDGSVTAGNASGLNDGAAAITLATMEAAESAGLTPRFAVLGYAHAGVRPEVMGIGPVPAVRKLLERTGLTVDDFDVIESNEALAAQALAVSKELGFDPAKVNPNGGAIALGHPVGATGAIITVKAMYELDRIEGKRALITMCIGGGQGIALAIERL